MAEALEEKDYNDALDDIFLSEDAAYRQSYNQGFLDGKAAGNAEAYHLGYHRGAELGRELGRIRVCPKSFADRYESCVFE